MLSLESMHFLLPQTYENFIPSIISASNSNIKGTMFQTSNECLPTQFFHPNKRSMTFSNKSHPPNPQESKNKAPQHFNKDATFIILIYILHWIHVFCTFHYLTMIVRLPMNNNNQALVPKFQNQQPHVFFSTILFYPKPYS